MLGLASNLKPMTLMTKFSKIQWKLPGVPLLSFCAKPKYTFLREYRNLEAQTVVEGQTKALSEWGNLYVWSEGYA